MSRILNIIDLSVSIRDKKNIIKIIENISFSLEKGEKLGIIGSSGSGKSTIAFTISNLLLDRNYIIKGSIDFGDNINLLSLKSKNRRKKTVDNVGIIFQNALSSLDPYETVESQLLEIIFFNKKIKGEKAKEIMRNALKKVGLEKEKDLSKKYPHQLSGGMKQRIILAMHIIISPNILIADEPTSALDGIHKLKFVKLLKDISENEHMAVIFISHNIALVSYFCDNILVIDKR